MMVLNEDENREEIAAEEIAAENVASEDVAAENVAAEDVAALEKQSADEKAEASDNAVTEVSDAVSEEVLNVPSEVSDREKESSELTDSASEDYESPLEKARKTLTEEDFLKFVRAQFKSKKIRMLIAISIFGLLLAGAFFWGYMRHLNGWHEDSNGRYYLINRNRLTGMKKIDNVIYLFDNNGYVIEGAAEYDGKIYYSSRQGLQNGSVNIDGEEYFFDENDNSLRRGFYSINGLRFYRNSHGFAEEGIREVNGKIYLMTDGGRLLSGWLRSDKGTRYFTPSDCSMLTGFQTISGEHYFFDWNGYVQKGFIRDEQTCYYAEEQNGAFRYGKLSIDGTDYLLLEDGTSLNGISAAEDGSSWFFRDNAYCYGWINDETGTFYCGENGLYIGPQVIDGRDFYFEEDFRLAKGWVNREGDVYFFDDDGAMLTGWQTIEDKKYCFADTGVMYTGEQVIDKVKYFFAEDGAYYDGFVDNEIGHQYFEKGFLQTGVKKIDGKYYYLNKDGVPTGGKQTVNGLLAMYEDDGTAVSGWQTVDDKKYYFNDDGTMMAGNVSINGKRYYLSREGGFLPEGWHTDGGKFYCYADGTLATGVSKIGGVLYGFGDNGILISKEGVQKVSGELRYVYADGKLAVNTEKVYSNTVYSIDGNGVARQKFGTITDANLDEYLDYVINVELNSKDIKVLYNWVKNRIRSYRYWSSDGKGMRALAIEALNNSRRDGACWHYASLMTLILQKAGYEAKIVVGGGHMYSVHQWTAVKVNGEWKYIDAMKPNVFLYSQAQLDAVPYTFSKGFGPHPEQDNYQGQYYYGYTKP